MAFHTSRVYTGLIAETYHNERKAYFQLIVHYYIKECEFLIGIRTFCNTKTTLGHIKRSAQITITERLRTNFLRSIIC